MPGRTHRRWTPHRQAQTLQRTGPAGPPEGTHAHQDPHRALHALHYSPYLTQFILDAAAGHSLCTELHPDHVSIFAAYHHGVAFLEQGRIKIAVKPERYAVLKALHPAWGRRGQWGFERQNTTMFPFVDDDMAREYRELLIDLFAEAVDWRSRGRSRPGSLPDFETD